MEDIGCCPSNVTLWSRYFRTFWKPQILPEVNKVPNLASSQYGFYVNLIPPKKKKQKIQFFMGV